jgi:signal transduction histidine kinase
MTRAPGSIVELKMLADEQAALRRVAALVATDPDGGRLFEGVCEELGRVLGIKSTNVVRYLDDGTQEIVGAWAESGEPWFKAGIIVPVDGDAVSAMVRRSGQAQRVDDYAMVSGELAARIRAVGIRSAVGAPISVAGRLWGCILASSGTPHCIAEDTESRLGIFAELVTAALANADARAELAASRARIIEAADLQRRRLGRDLHDGAQQVLVSAVMSLRLAQRKWMLDPDEARELMDEALEQMQAGIRDLRELATGIHPSILTDRGLRFAVEALATRSPMPVELGELPAERLPEPVETTAYFIVAEGLTNAAKHARCSRADVAVRVGPAALAVEVSDDGIGGADPASGSGLRGLADRVNGLGGSLDVESPAGEGTIVRASITLAGSH